MTDAPLREDDWDRHWADYADSASRNPGQALRRRVIHSLLRAPAEGARILDLGCGQGDLIEDLHHRHARAELCGIDYSRHGVEVAARKVPSATFLQCDLLSEAAPAPGFEGWATHAVCSEVLEHVDQPEVLLNNARAWLAPGCRLVVTVPGGPMSAFDRHIGHRQHFSTDSLRRLLASSGFRVEKVLGAGFPLFNLYRLAVISRGKRLAGDVEGDASWLARAAMAGFHVLLSAPQPSTPWGWQRAAVAQVERPAC
ncbi:MAG: class I SAM-dependent methyltransferase [Acidimicrobiaceae bacterium]|nr:class I SAM-dependent methyltransferase [Acidimicrobiaceae bacterium]